MPGSLEGLLHTENRRKAGENLEEERKQEEFLSAQWLHILAKCARNSQPINFLFEWFELNANVNMLTCSK